MKEDVLEGWSVYVSVIFGAIFYQVCRNKDAAILGQHL